ncbi:PREDICTED: ubiquinone biosynthesis monooxygenase COQ6, mitochondrial [Nicrophorus vespilloides]|uniref:Ubiquinone biosynthesis monooxygenase COQ6, mitochondrial n=1 Tax=Nicrophorus vespilloides TaxID=110193 RepID=A0ABM1M1U6_NICVS|nr:PREDICTED: ubiquinone biosynthesis monooxygenase COQ6, mitochondrial [Nicrophorus vespilloides]
MSGAMWRSERAVVRFLQRRIISVRNYSNAGDNHFDIIIAGGGMVGTSLATALGKNSRLSSKRILLLEGAKEFSWTLQEGKYSNRVVALNPNTRNFFSSLGVWNAIEDGRYGTVRKMQVWDGLSNAMITFSHDNLIDPVAYIVENDLILDAVNREAKTLNNVKILNEAKIKGYKLKGHESNVNSVVMDNGNNYTCNLLLGCDGANSQVRKAMDVQNMSWNYDQMGVVATLHLSEANDNIVAWQRFLPKGPIALLPLADNLSSLVWSTSPDEAKHLLGLPNDQFVDAVNGALWKVHTTAGFVDEVTKAFDGFMQSLIGRSNAVRQLPPHVASLEDGSRAAFPLGFGHAINYVKDGVALVGDAAHRVHPLAGQGVNLGFGDAACLSRLLGESVYNGKTLGDLDDLKHYECERQRHNVPTMLAVDGLQKLYNTEFTPVVLLRSVGLQFTNALDPLKKLIMQQSAA